MCAHPISETYEVHIEAPPEKVWPVLIDVERWPEWTQSMRQVVQLSPGEFGLGSDARLEVKGAPTSVWRVTEFTPNRSFTWQTKERGVASVAVHTLEPEGDGTKLTLSVEMAGLMATLFSPMIRGVVKRNIRLEGDGLKARVEGG